MNFEYQIGVEWKKTAWAWATITSYQTSIFNKKIRPADKMLTMADAQYLHNCISGMATNQGITHNIRRNKRAVAAALAQKRVCSIKDLFTAPCADCGSPAERIPRELPEFRNAPAGVFCPNCKKVFPSRGIFAGKAVFLVAAGPSLDKNGAELKRVCGKYPIFAVDTVLNSLIKKGIKPDYVVTIEQDPLIKMCLKDVDTTDIALLAGTGTDPGFRNLWKGPVYVFDSPYADKRDRIARQKYLGDIGWVTPGGNVSTIMLGLAIGGFASPLVLVGHDFSYESLERYYPDGGPKSMVPLKTVYSTHDIYGREVYCDAALYGYKDWTEKAVATVRGPIFRFVNATEGGILGAQYYDPQKYVRIRRKARVWKYQFEKLWQGGHWPSAEEAEKRGFVAKRLDCLEYLTLREAIDKYCLDVYKE